MPSPLAPMQLPVQEKHEKQRVAKQMILALEHLEKQSAAAKPMDAEDLACKCYDKLQFDFPVRMTQWNT